MSPQKQIENQDLRPHADCSCLAGCFVEFVVF